MIELVIEPRRTMGWDDFLRAAPPRSLALDGYVAGAPRFDRATKKLSLNHHEGVDRLGTRCTASQLFMHLKKGLFSLFTGDDGLEVRLYVNDPDQDVCLATWLAYNHERITGERSEPLINRLLFIEDALDVTAGVYPYPLKSKIMREQAWIFEPYTASRSRLGMMDEAGMRAIIESVHQRITAYTLGNGSQTAPDDRFQLLYRGRGWLLIEEEGTYARSRLAQQGYGGCVVLRGERRGRYDYTLCELNYENPLNLPRLYDLLNEAEQIPRRAKDRWGGSDTVGGSPREKGSGLAPDELARLIDASLGNASGVGAGGGRALPSLTR